MSTKLIIESLTYSMPLLLTAGLVALAKRFDTLDGVYRTLFAYLVMAWAIDVMSRIFGLALHNNLVFIPLFGLLELGMFTWLYWRYFLQGQPKTLLVLPAIGMVFIGWEFYKAGWADPHKFHAYSRVVTPVIIVFLSILHYKEIGMQSPLRLENMRLNAAILLFFSLSMVFFLPVNFLINVPSEVKFWFWLANLLLTLTFYTFLILEIWKNGKIQRQLHRGY